MNKGHRRGEIHSGAFTFDPIVQLILIFQPSIELSFSIHQIISDKILSLPLGLKRQRKTRIFANRFSVPGHGVKSDHFCHHPPLKIGLKLFTGKSIYRSLSVYEKRL